MGPPSQRKILSEKTLKEPGNKAETSPKKPPNISETSALARFFSIRKPAI